MPNKIFKQDGWNGGLSDSPFIGFKGSFAEAVGVDIFSTPYILKVSQALSKESGSTVIDFPKWAFNCSNGKSYWFGDAGNIYERTSAGAWSKIYTDANGAILGACEFNGYIYYTTNTKLARWQISGGIGTIVTNWQTLDAATYHPMTVQGLYLFIGNDRKMASVDDAGTFTAAGIPSVAWISLSPNYSIKTLVNYGIDILIGVLTNNQFSNAGVFRWDTVSPTYTTSDYIQEDAINAFLPQDNVMFVQAGANGNIYYYDGTNLSKAKHIWGNYSNKKMTVHPDSFCNYKSLSLFGVSNSSGNPCNEGIYALGRYDRNYPLALCLPYVISQNKLSSIEIGSLVEIGETLLVAWKDGTNYGVDAINWNSKYNNAFIKTIMITGENERMKTFQNYVVSYKTKPTNTNLTLKYDKNFTDIFTDTIPLKDQSDYSKMRAQQNIEAGALQFKLEFTTDGNNAPEVRSLYCDFEEKSTL